MAADGCVALMEDGSRLQERLGGAKQGLDLPELLVLERDFLGRQGGIGAQDPLAVVTRLGLKAIAGKTCTGLRRIFARLQGAPTGAWLGYVTAGATPKAGEKTRTKALTSVVVPGHSSQAIGWPGLAGAAPTTRVA